MKDTVVGVDLSKHVFPLNGTSMAAQSPAVVVMEACGSASYGRGK